MREHWSDPDSDGSRDLSWRGSEPQRRRADPRRGSGDGLEQGLDRLVSAGRQLVDGVSGARPGSRPAATRAPGRAGAGLPRLNELGRWVEDKLDWILDDEDDWSEPWQEDQARASRPLSRPPSRLAAQQAPQQAPQQASQQPERRDPPRSAPRRRPLEAISRRGGARALNPEAGGPPLPPVSGPGEDWPEAEAFSLPRWQRPARAGAGVPEAPGPAPGTPRGTASGGDSGSSRPMPRSSRRRSG